MWHCCGQYKRIIGPRHDRVDTGNSIKTDIYKILTKCVHCHKFDMMTSWAWKPEKNNKLREIGRPCFEDVLVALENGNRNEEKKPVFKLSEDEQKFESEIERGDWTPESKKDSERFRAVMVEAAHNGNKDARVNLRLNPDDVKKIREKAAREGISYQTLIGSVLHKYATDQFLDEKAVQDVVRRLSSKKIAN